MKLTRREFLHLSTAAAVAGGVTLLPVGQAAALAAPSVQQLVEEAYLYAFPLVLMDATKIVSTNTETATERRAPVNQLIHVRSLMDASSSVMVSIKTPPYRSPLVYHTSPPRTIGPGAA